jgi:FkbM family methyltransferase
VIEAVRNLTQLFSNHPLTQDNISAGWLRFISWQIGSRLKKEIIFPWIEGQHLAVKRGMTGATGNIYVGLHEFADMMFLLHFLRRHDGFVDVGANVGSYTVLASGVCGAKTYAFEPDPNSVAHLRRNISVNSLEDLVVVFEYALGADRKDVLFTVNLDTMNKVVSCEGLTARDEPKVRLVRQERLDDVIGKLTTDLSQSRCRRIRGRSCARGSRASV